MLNLNKSQTMCAVIYTYIYIYIILYALHGIFVNIKYLFIYYSIGPLFADSFVYKIFAHVHNDAPPITQLTVICQH